MKNVWNMRKIASKMITFPFFDFIFEKPKLWLKTIFWETITILEKVYGNFRKEEATKIFNVDFSLSCN